jgi:hypothetical protein
MIEYFINFNLCLDHYNVVDFQFLIFDKFTGLYFIRVYQIIFFIGFEINSQAIKFYSLHWFDSIMTYLFKFVWIFPEMIEKN